MPDFRITIDMENVTTGEVKELRDVLEKWGEGFDEARGEFVVRWSTRHGQSGDYVPYAWEGDHDEGAR